MNTIVICHSTLKENNIHLIIANETKKEIKTEQKKLDGTILFRCINIDQWQMFVSA